MADLPDLPPRTFHPADEVAWKVTYSDYPNASGWQIRYSFVASDQQIIIPGTVGGETATVVDAGGGVWTATMPAAFTSVNFTLTASETSKKFRWTEYVEKAPAPTERATLRKGYLTLARNLDSGAISSGLDLRTHAEITLDNIEAVIQGKATKDQFSYSIAGRALSRYSWRELLALREHYRAEVRREQLADRQARGLGNRSVIKARFGGLR